MREIVASKRFEPLGFCRVCERAARFRVAVDRKALRRDGGSSINLRETLTCANCGLNNRQRLVAAEARSALRAVRERGRPAIVYAMERVTAFYRWLESRQVDCRAIGSEYLGPDHVGGTVVKGVRHEDAMALTLADASVDLVISNDVLEHVPDPGRAIAEMRRVLRPGGRALCTFPFLDQEETRVRARRAPDGSIEHLWPAVWHGNPVSTNGSLVFFEFGWDVLSWFRAQGFADVCMLACWSYEALHVGGPQLVLVAE